MLNKRTLLLFCILFLGLFLRLYGNNWDQGWHLHPDERFLTMVGVDVKLPSTLTSYMDQKISPFNPANTGKSFFVYGTFPILLNKVIAQYFFNDSYGQFNLQGRVISGIADFLVIILIYKLIENSEQQLKLSPSIKYLSAFLYAIAVLPIQLAHFYTVDSLLNLFCWLSFYFAVKIVCMSHISVNTSVKNHSISINRGTLIYLWYLVLSGIFLGLAMACKISAVYMAPLIGSFIFLGMIKNIFMNKGRKLSLVRWGITLIGVLFFSITLYITLRFGSPYYFESGNIGDLTLSTTFLKNIETLKSFDSPKGLFPPAIQWLSKGVDFPIKNMFFFGVGPIYFLTALWGIIELFKRKSMYLFIPLVWFFIFLIYESFQFTKTMRYLIFLYPILAISAAVGIEDITSRLQKIQSKFVYLSICLFIYLSIIIWPLAFMSIYTKDHSRVTASNWIYNTVPQNSGITFEYWDDPLPLLVQDPRTRNYRGIEIHIFDPDSKQKWNVINDLLKNADYYIMSSNRGWGSISSVPELYPATSEFYRNMMSGAGEFRLVKEFSSYPSLRYLGIPIDFPDQWAEEAFSVYDHPLVSIYKKK